MYGYLHLVRTQEIRSGDSINIVVPTGNFGNILAAYYALRIGIPINKLICASNDNNVLSDFFRTKTYDKNRKLLLTSSPSMDILVSSNLERFLYHQIEDDTKVKELMKDLSEKGVFKFLEDMDIIYGGFADENKISHCINEVYTKFNYIMDPHTAVAYAVYKEYIEETNDTKATLISSTASPFKFSNKVLSSIGKVVSKDEFENLKELASTMNQNIPEQLMELKTLRERHNLVCEVDMMKDIVEAIIGGEYNA